MLVLLVSLPCQTVLAVLALTLLEEGLILLYHWLLHQLVTRLNAGPVPFTLLLQLPQFLTLV